MCPLNKRKIPVTSEQVFVVLCTWPRLVSDLHIGGQLCALCTIILTNTRLSKIPKRNERVWKDGWNDAALRQEDEQIRREANIDEGEGVTQSGVQFVSVLLPRRTCFIHFQLQTEWNRGFERAQGRSETHQARSFHTLTSAAGPVAM